MKIRELSGAIINHLGPILCFSSLLYALEMEDLQSDERMRTER